jgi:hypothetical protein
MTLRRHLAAVYNCVSQRSGQKYMLKSTLTGIFLVFGGVACATAAPAEGQVVLNGTLASNKSPADQSEVTRVKPGEELTITGDCVANVKSADRLRVMMTLANETGAVSGYHVLATDQTIGAEGLNVRVPNLPETANRDFNVRVFRLGDDSPQICNAGTIHVGAPAKHHLG